MVVDALCLCSVFTVVCDALSVWSVFMLFVMPCVCSVFSGQFIVIGCVLLLLHLGLTSLRSVLFCLTH